MGGEGAASPGAEPGLEVMLHLHFLGLGVSTLPSEDEAVDAAAPASVCCVHENRRGSTIPNRLSSFLHRLQ